MSRRSILRFGGWLLLVLAVTALAYPRAAKEVVEIPLLVKVFDYTSVQSWRLHRAEGIADRILIRGVGRVVWLDCPVDMNGRQVDPRCASQGPLTLEISIYADGPTPGPRHDVLGYVTTSGSSPHRATIYYRRIQEQAAAGCGLEEEILGPVLAHEIGHLLLGPVLGFEYHSADGVMRAHLSPVEFHLASVARLRFKPGEAAALRNEMDRRTRVYSAALLATVATRVGEPL